MNYDQSSIISLENKCMINICIVTSSFRSKRGILLEITQYTCNAELIIDGVSLWQKDILMADPKPLSDSWQQAGQRVMAGVVRLALGCTCPAGLLKTPQTICSWSLVREASGTGSQEDRAAEMHREREREQRCTTTSIYHIKIKKQD